MALTDDLQERGKMDTVIADAEVRIYTTSNKWTTDEKMTMKAGW